jgi:hypothetical protein
LFGLLGCEGVSGPRGETGDTGDSGDPWQPQVPENRFFAVAVCNGSMVNHNGAPKLYLSFDGEHANAGDTIYCYQLGEGQVPEIDGVDEGATAWGDKPTTVALEKVSGKSNFIDSATVKSAFDLDYIYFQVKWTEVENQEYGFSVGKSAESQYWQTADGYEDLTSVLDRSNNWNLISGSTDHLLLLFQINEVSWFDHDGCFVTCHSGEGETNFHRTDSPPQRLDSWVWTAGLLEETGFAADRYIDNDVSPILSLSWDVGTPPYQLNYQSRRFEVPNADDVVAEFPAYQHLNDPNYNAPLPLWDHELITLDIDEDTPWESGSTIPSYFSSVPTGSNADIVARGSFDEGTGTWTVEFKRARRTGNGDDVQF